MKQREFGHIEGTFFHIDSKGHLFVHAGLYAERREAVLAAYDLNRSTGRLTCMVPGKPKQLIWVSDPQEKLPPKVAFRVRPTDRAFGM